MNTPPHSLAKHASAMEHKADAPARSETRETGGSMTAMPTTAGQGWDQAVFRCGRCGAEHTATTEDDYLKTVAVHGDAHEVWDRLNPTERRGFISILRIIMSAPELATELLALADRQPPECDDR
ncbi:hypothetical protein [Streptomyces sp. NPDC001948]